MLTFLDDIFIGSYDYDGACLFGSSIYGEGSYCDDLENSALEVGADDGVLPIFIGLSRMDRL